MGCSSGDGERESQRAATSSHPRATRITQGLTPHAPPGVDGDALAGLPETDSTARILVATVDEDSSVLIIDLRTGRAVTVAVDDDPQFPAVLTPDGAAVATGPRAITVLDGDGRAVVTSQLPPEVPGTIHSLTRADDSIIVDVAPAPDASGVRSFHTRATLVYGFGGRLRCVWDGHASGLSTAGQLWSGDLRTRLDLRTCRTAPGLRPGGQRISGHLTAAAGSAMYVPLGEDRVGRFPTGDGRLERRSPDLGDYVSSVAVSEGLWVLVDDRLLRLDEDTLDIRDEVYRFPCPEGGQVLADGSRIYVVSCSQALYEFDARTGSVVDAWALPHDRFSDLEPWATMTPEGLWIVDPEQISEPYLFNVHRRRFERLALDEGLRSRITPFGFDVMG
jgi:hypothetical protein